MKYTNKDFTVTVNRTRVIFSGRIKEFDDSMVDFLEESLFYKNRIIFDFTALHELNTNGVYALARVLENSSQYITVKINNDYSWQKPTISALNIIKPGGLKIVS